MSVRREVDCLGRTHFRSEVTGRFVVAPAIVPSVFYDYVGRLHSVLTGRYVKPLALIARVPVEEKVFYRFVVAVNGVPVQRKYHSFTLMRWYDHEPNESEKEYARQALLKYMEKELGYGQDDWWFMAGIGEGLQEADGLKEDYFEHHRP